MSSRCSACARALSVLVESLIARFRYLDETIAVVLGLVGVKLLIEDIVKVGPVPSLAVIAVAFAMESGSQCGPTAGSGCRRRSARSARSTCETRAATEPAAPSSGSGLRMRTCDLPLDAASLSSH